MCAFAGLKMKDGNIYKLGTDSIVNFDELVKFFKANFHETNPDARVAFGKTFGCQPSAVEEPTQNVVPTKQQRVKRPKAEDGTTTTTKAKRVTKKQDAGGGPSTKIWTPDEIDTFAYKQEEITNMLTDKMLHIIYTTDAAQMFTELINLLMRTFRRSDGNVYDRRILHTIDGKEMTAKAFIFANVLNPIAMALEDNINLLSKEITFEQIMQLKGELSFHDAWHGQFAEQTGIYEKIEKIFAPYEGGKFYGYVPSSAQ